MMMHRSIQRFLALALPLALCCMAGCGPAEDLTGGSTSESSNAFITGTVTRTDGSPADSVPVYVRPADAVRTAGDDSPEMPATVTDRAGCFSIDTLQPGGYVVECVAPDEDRALVRLDATDAGTPLRLTLRPAGALRGTVTGAPGDSVFISVRGLWRSVWAQPDGGFTLTGIAEGTYTVRFDAPWGIYQRTLGIIERENVVVAAGETTYVDTVNLPPRDAYAADSAYVRDAAAVQLILDTNGVTAPLEEFTGVMNGRITVLADEHGALSVLPSALGALTALEILILHNGGLATLPGETANLDALVRLDLVNQTMTALPPVVSGLRSLVELNAVSLDLDAVPAEVFSLPRLQYLSLKDNRITELPETVSSLVLLKRLDLRDNSLTALPGVLAGMPQLRELYVSGNPICAVPDSLAAWLATITTDWNGTCE